MQSISYHTFKNKPIKGYTSVIIPVYKDAMGLRDTLDSLRNQSISKDTFEVIVCNDGHDIGISDVCKEYGCVEVFSEVNNGSYFARNMGIANSKGEFLVFTDADIKVNVDWIKQYIKDFKKGNDYIGGSVVIDDFKVKSLTNKYLSLVEFESSEVFDSMHFSATANVAVRRSVFEELGCFDERLFSAGDYEFGDRIFRSKKFKMNFVKDNIVVHPPRDDSQYYKKLRRLAKGERHLNALYPGRFAHLNKSAVEELRNTLYIPGVLLSSKWENKLLLMGLHIWYQFYRAIYSIWYEFMFVPTLK